MRWIVFGSSLTLLACGPATANQDQLLRRASFDLKCDRGNIKTYRIDDKTMGVRGCEQQLTYLEVCDGPPLAMGTKCTWALDSDNKLTPKD